jgi:RHH-type proline utilization regulon transcriptional repressor/proline dehydrogenase/delta 1-pyrroline-5-carboxylate dehydrogenase
VRRLLENGANTSFVHSFLDEDVPAERIATDPYTLLSASPRATRASRRRRGSTAPRAQLARPRLSQKAVRDRIHGAVASAGCGPIAAAPIVGGKPATARVTIPQRRLPI